VFISILTSYNIENEERIDGWFEYYSYLMQIDIPIYNDIVKIENCLATYCST